MPVARCAVRDAGLTVLGIHPLRLPERSLPGISVSAAFGRPLALALALIRLPTACSQPPRLLSTHVLTPPVRSASCAPARGCPARGASWPARRAGPAARSRAHG